jgi:hypothetical protein
MKTVEGKHLQPEEEHLYFLSLDCSALLYTSVLLDGKSSYYLKFNKIVLNQALRLFISDLCAENLLKQLNHDISASEKMEPHFCASTLLVLDCCHGTDGTNLTNLLSFFQQS